MKKDNNTQKLQYNRLLIVLDLKENYMESVKMKIRGTRRKFEAGRTKRRFSDNSKRDHPKWNWMKKKTLMSNRSLTWGKKDRKQAENGIENLHNEIRNKYRQAKEEWRKKMNRNRKNVYHR